MSRKRATRDGLELFLDAICNMFGGFIFIMLFVVVSIRMSTEEQRAELKASGIEPVKEVELETLRVELDRLNKDIKNVVKQQEDSRKFVEDLVDSGRTLAALRRHFIALGASEVKSAVLVKKLAPRAEDAPVDFYALEAENLYLVGYGLDDAENGRQLPDIWVVEEPAE